MALLLSSIAPGGCAGPAVPDSHPGWQPAEHNVFGQAVIDGEAVDRGPETDTR